jgi:hypothetical protein
LVGFLLFCFVFGAPRPAAAAASTAAAHPIGLRAIYRNRLLSKYAQISAVDG